ncbi:hypothetical protein KBX53_00385 [Micromonospora sp. M51]|uniref:tetratricopeptide repeat protein n=1 Tax=Micromonospora sp. M51 TaxID=2824889 RepID=UPI001B3717A5|nr:hypothetical protein [Micromonospora sp. M51]MBQ1009438.1 hypothetical protein [Micromonospora sp. M51]
MPLKSRSRVGEILRGLAWPADDAQAESLMRALDPAATDLDRGKRLYKKARIERDAAKARHERPDWRRRSGYVEQLADLAPLELLDRASELDELAEWCASDEAYVWWQAPARSGKSALMSWFALYPPPDVWVVSFFITARLASQADSAAFTDGLLDQLAAVIGEQLPPVTSAAERDRLRRRLLAEAVAKATAAGHKLVLLVDGLDEDTGSLPGSSQASIAALLPKRPNGLKVIVSGRPDPPLPGDLDPDHPLRTARRRSMTASPHARRVTELADQELDEILAVDTDRHDGLGFQVLGLVAASGGGLSHADLQVLTGRPAYQIDRLLKGVFGRTVAGRTDGRADGRVFLFTHETLRVQALQRLGPHTLAGFRERLHTWADTYRQRHWPSDTPSYMIRGYFRMLIDSGDQRRMINLAADPARHARMLDISGGDVSALAEIRQTQDVLLTAAVPDLYALALLSIHRDRLETRNGYLPVGLPAVWAALGQPTRAEAIARGIPEAEDRAKGLAEVAVALDGTDPGRAADVLANAEQFALELIDLDERIAALAAVAQSAAKLGDRERASRLIAAAGDFVSSVEDGQALTTFAEAAARLGEYDHVKHAASRITFPASGADAVTDLVVVLAEEGDFAGAAKISTELDPVGLHGRAAQNLVRAAVLSGDQQRVEQLISDVERSGRETPHLHDQVLMLSRAAIMAMAAGDHHRAQGLVDEAKQLAEVLPEDDGLRVTSLFELTEAAREVGDPKCAEWAAGNITDYGVRGAAADLAVIAWAEAGEYERAKQVASAITDQEWHDTAFSSIARAMIAAGDNDAAEQVSRRVAYPPARAEILVEIARALMAGGTHSSAKRLIAEAECVARDTVDPLRLAEAQAAIARELERSGAHERAERLARTIAEPPIRIMALASIAQLGAGIPAAASRIAAEAESLLPKIADETYRYAWDDAPAAVARALAAVGEHARAEQVASRIDLLGDRVAVMVDLAVAGRATLLADAEVLAREISWAHQKVSALADIAWAASMMKDTALADRLQADAGRAARAIIHPGLREKAMVRAGIELGADDVADPNVKAQILIDRVNDLMQTGRIAEAERTARSIDQVDERLDALTVIAVGLGVPDGARLIGEVFAAGPWLLPLKALPQDILLRIADQVFPES